MRVTILHQAVGRDASEDEKDVLFQAKTVSESLKRLGHTVETAEATLDLERTRLELVATDPDCVFYLVESLDGTDSLAHLPAFLLETMEIPYTGAPAAALVLSNNKIRAKRTMALAGLPTPPWLETARRRRSPDPCAAACRQAVSESTHCLQARSGTQPENNLPASELHFPATFILKPIEEHASLGMTDDCVYEASDERQLQSRLEEQSSLVDRACFAEQFVEGREFNLAVLGTPEGPIVLPPAEIDFSAFPAGKPHIVGYDAKWASGSFEYANTPRQFPCTPGSSDFELGVRLSDLARRCWTVFGLHGYARVDFRVDGRGNPWILEVNANPCLSPDAGYAAALQEAGISFDQAIQAILNDT
ncbi:MAG: D-alanine--D-alanine ligase [Planctomycetaceae bacterium]|nr:D-alanine--D-alanine ligase [Planctomycetaceae bacterium]